MIPIDFSNSQCIIKHTGVKCIDWMIEIILASSGWWTGHFKSLPNAVTGKTQLALAA